MERSHEIVPHTSSITYSIHNYSHQSGGHKRVKRHHNKVRSGCKVCRTRRVKCDELRPTCTHCIRRGLWCTYDRPKEFVPVNKDLPYISGSLNRPQGDSDHQRFFDYYLMSKKSRFANPAPGFSIVNMTWVYLTIIPQIAQTSETVRHAISASASAEEHLLRQEDAPEWLIKQQQQYFQSTIKAILNNKMSTEELIMCCLLLFAYSCFTNDYNAVLIHFQSGVRLVEEGKKHSRASILSDAEKVFEELELSLTRIAKGECPIPVEKSHPHAAKRGVPLGCV